MAILQRPKGDSEKWTAHFPNDHFKGFGVAMNGSAIHFMIGAPIGAIKAYTVEF